VHINIARVAEADGRRLDAVFSFEADLGGSISANTV
jgi:hypothetical protein